MVNPIIAFEVGKSIQEDRLREIEQLRLLNSVRPSLYSRLKKQLQRFKLEDVWPKPAQRRLRPVRSRS